MLNMLEYISEWLAFNIVSLNIQKTVFISFGYYCDSVLIIILKINEPPIKKVKQCNHLGVIFNYKLKLNIFLNELNIWFTFHKMKKIRGHWNI